MKSSPLGTVLLAVLLFQFAQAEVRPGKEQGPPESNESQQVKGLQGLSGKITSPGAGSSSRFFLLMFTLTDLSREMEEGIDYLFDQVLHKNDQVMIMANNIVIREHTLLDPVQERKQLKNVLNKVGAATEQRQEETISNLHALLKQAVRDATSIEVTAEEHSADLPNNLTRCLGQFQGLLTRLSDYKQAFVFPNTLGLPEVLSNLAEGDRKKWLVHFYQLELFPELTINTRDHRNIERIIMDSKSFLLGDCAVAARALENVLIQYDQEIDLGSSFPAVELGRLFEQAGVIYHPMFLRTSRKGVLKKSGYEAVASGIEKSLRQIAELNRIDY